MMITNRVLDDLVASGDLKSFQVTNLDDHGNVGRSKSRNTERAILEFPSGKKLVIDTFCSGCLEDTGLGFSMEVSQENCPDCLGTKMDMDLYGHPCGTCGGQGTVRKGFAEERAARGRPVQRSG